MPLDQLDNLSNQKSKRRRELKRTARKADLRSSRQPASRRSGFSLIELLFVAGVVCVLISALLPAVQQAREAARRTQCKHRLAQLSLAILSYHDMHSLFPPGCVNETGPIASKAEGLHTSWLVQILPMMDQPALALRHRPEVSVYDEQHAELRARSLRNFLCPSDGFPAVTDDGIAVTNYAGVTGGSDVVIDSDNRGIFFLNSSVSATHIGDGSSNQIAIAEHRRHDLPSGIDLGWMSGTSATLRNGGILINTVSSSPQAGPAVYETTGGFSSSHTGGAQVGLADGSVRFISENISATILSQLCDINDGHDVGDF